VSTGGPGPARERGDSKRFANPVDKTGGVTSVELVFSTPESVKSPPLPKGIPGTFLFSVASPDGVSVELHFDAAGAGTLQQIDGAILLNVLSLPEQRRGTENDFNDLIGE
jgi:hypothetical protein